MFLTRERQLDSYQLVSRTLTHVEMEWLGWLATVTLKYRLGQGGRLLGTAFPAPKYIITRTINTIEVK
jgi:hypothetical protein